LLLFFFFFHILHQGTNATQDAGSWQWAMEAVPLALRTKHCPKPTRQIVEYFVRKRSDKEESSLYKRGKATWSRVGPIPS
jgi:hypothetical protein